MVLYVTLRSLATVRPLTVEDYVLAARCGEEWWQILLLLVLISAFVVLKVSVCELVRGVEPPVALLRANGI